MIARRRWLGAEPSKSLDLILSAQISASLNSGKIRAKIQRRRPPTEPVFDRGGRMINDTHRLDNIDRLEVFPALSFAVSVVLNLLPNNGGETGRIIANLATIFGLIDD